MDAVLVQPDTSARPVLILALGTDGADARLPGRRESITARIFDLYKNDPDAGIRGAPEWVVRQ
jgi:hypothetical protein